MVQTYDRKSWRKPEPCTSCQRPRWSQTNEEHQISCCNSWNDSEEADMKSNIFFLLATLILVNYVEEIVWMGPWVSFLALFSQFIHVRFCTCIHASETLFRQDRFKKREIICYQTSYLVMK